MAGEHYDSVPVRVVRDDEQGVYKVGVVIDSAFVTIAGIKTGTVDELVEREQTKADDRARVEREQQQRQDDELRRQEYERQRREAEQQSQSQSQTTASSGTPPPPQTAG